ncbi:hypothetical protein LCGC14_1211980 [marine sediment metagenome]|uniref:Uncharacterized protein n=1 Tax=marine sediment metagenome TaxID=412755 RepID=A0A0F9PIC7_9ZZZZ
MNWITRYYPIGAEIQVPPLHISTTGTLPAKVVNHATDNVAHPMQKGPTGIIVRFEDGTVTEIDRAYLRESGGGT